MPLLLQLQSLQGKGDQGWKKVSLHHFSADLKKVWECVDPFCVFLHPIAQATSYWLLPDTFWLQAFRNACKVGAVMQIHGHHPPLWRKYALEVAKGLKQCQVKSRELTTLPELPDNQKCFVVWKWWESFPHPPSWLLQSHCFASFTAKIIKNNTTLYAVMYHWQFCTNLVLQTYYTVSESGIQYRWV